MSLVTIICHAKLSSAFVCSKHWREGSDQGQDVCSQLTKVDFVSLKSHKGLCGSPKLARGVETLSSTCAYKLLPKLLVLSGLGLICLVCLGSGAAAPSRLSPEPAMSQVAAQHSTAQHSSQGHAGSVAGSAVHAAEARDAEASSNGALPQGFFEV